MGAEAAFVSGAWRRGGGRGGVGPPWRCKAARVRSFAELPPPRRRAFGGVLTPPRMRAVRRAGGENSSHGGSSPKENGGDAAEEADNDEGEAPSPTTTTVTAREEPEEAAKGGAAADGEAGGGVQLASGAAAADANAAWLDIQPEDIAGIRLIFGSETFFATEMLRAPGGLLFRGNLRADAATALAKLEKRLHSRFGERYTICLAEGDDDFKPMVVVVPTMRDRRPSSLRQRVVAALAALAALATSISRMSYTLAVRGGGAAHERSPPPLAWPPRWSLLSRNAALPLGLGLVAALLLCHVVQRAAASARRVRLSTPILLPSYSLGAYGAMTNVVSPPSSRNALFDIAVAGAGTLLLASLGAFVLGVRLTAAAARGGGAALWAVPTDTLADSLLLSWLAKRMLGAGILRSAGGERVGLHWLAVLGANGSMVAALNLLPIRQLDGGRIVSAVYGRKTAMLVSRVTIALLLMSTPSSAHFLFFLAFVLFGPWMADRPARNELSETDNVRALVGIACLVLTLLVMLPVPSNMSLL